MTALPTPGTLGTIPVVSGVPGPHVDTGLVAGPVSTPLVITVYGKPITQGSKTKNRWSGVRDDNAETLHPWRDNVRTATRAALEGRDGFGTDPVGVVIAFVFARPTTHYRTGRNAHLLRDTAPQYPSNRGSGDADKLQRACFDSLTDAGAWKDDSQVVDVHAVKVWLGSGHANFLGLAHPGAVIQVKAMP